MVYFFIALVTKWYSFLIAFLGRVAWFFNSAGGLVFFEHWPSFFLTFATKVLEAILGKPQVAGQNPEERTEDYIDAHRYSNNHMDALKRDRRCGCFYCLAIFDPSEIEDWIVADNPCDRYGTAICPHCGIDSVIGESSGYPITTEFLRDMRKRWFGC